LGFDASALSHGDLVHNYGDCVGTNANAGADVMHTPSDADEWIVLEASRWWRNKIEVMFATSGKKLKTLIFA